jgi:hypothetical protein
MGAKIVRRLRLLDGFAFLDALRDFRRICLLASRRNSIEF